MPVEYANAWGNKWSPHTMLDKKQMLAMWDGVAKALAEKTEQESKIEYSKADADLTLQLINTDPPKPPRRLVHAVVTYYDAEEEEVIYDLKCPLPCHMRPDDVCAPTLEWDAVGPDMFRTTQWSKEYGYTHTDLALGVHYFEMDYVGYGEDAEAGIEWLTEKEMKERAGG